MNYKTLWSSVMVAEFSAIDASFVKQVRAVLLKQWYNGIESLAANSANCSEECYGICYFFMSLKAGWVGSCIIISVLNQWVCCSVFVSLLLGHRTLQQIACIVLLYRQDHVTVFTELPHSRITFTFPVDKTAVCHFGLSWTKTCHSLAESKFGKWGKDINGKEKKRMFYSDSLRDKMRLSVQSRMQHNNRYLDYLVSEIVGSQNHKWKYWILNNCQAQQQVGLK